MSIQSQRRMAMKFIVLLSMLGTCVFSMNYPKDTCGLRPLKDNNRLIDKIVGGVASLRGDWPWVVSLQRNQNHFCGGSIINGQWILSAAHCFSPVQALTSYRVLFGLHDRLSADAWVISRGVRRVVVHPSYSSQNMWNDIALIELSASIDTYTDYYMPVCFPTANQTVDGAMADTVGWGAPNYGSTLLRYLSEVQTPILNDTACRTRYTTGRISTATQICSGGSSKGACQGDSGGPISFPDPKRNNRHVIVGITSWGIGCGQGGVYTRVSAYKDWVESFTGSTLS